MTDTMVREGRCICGETRYRVTGAPIMVLNCHCRQCQQQSGSTSVVNAFWESERMELLAGETSEFIVPAGSGADHTIARCNVCAAQLFSYYGSLGRLMVAVRAGTLDDPATVVPDVVIYTAEAMPWVGFPEGIARFEGNYNAREDLPPASLDRLRTLAARRKAGEG